MKATPDEKETAQLVARMIQSQRDLVQRAAGATGAESDWEDFYEWISRGTATSAFTSATYQAAILPDFCDWSQRYWMEKNFAAHLTMTWFCRQSKKQISVAGKLARQAAAWTSAIYCPDLSRKLTLLISI
jgi:hypothetical protein